MTFYKQPAPAVLFDRTLVHAGATPIAARRSPAAPPRNRLLFNPYFRALWMAMIASSVSTWMTRSDLSAAWPNGEQIFSLLARALGGPQLYLLVLLSITVSLHMVRHGHREFAFRPMGSNAFAVSVLTFFGFVGPLVALCTVVVLAFCAAMAMVAVLPMLLDALARFALQYGAVSGAGGVQWGRALANLVSGVMSTLLGPVAICILNAVAIVGVFVAVERSRRRRVMGGSTMPAWLG
jgi:hypothetical protein